MGTHCWLNTTMMYLLSLLVCALPLFAGPCSCTTQREQFQGFKAEYGKVYSSKVEEEARFQVFRKNLAMVEEHNRGNSSYTKGINRWSDFTQEEWEQVYLGGYKRQGPGSRMPASRPQDEKARVMELPESVDWRDKGVVSAVKDQGQCGSCWAHGATQQIETYTALASGTLLELSTQQMTSCTPNPLHCGGTGGCQGSTPPLGYSYVQLFGQVSESDYPYISGGTSNSEECQYNLANLTPVAAISGYDNLPPNNQEAIMDHIANVGPLAISVAGSAFKDYKDGVFDGCSYDENIQLNHAVQLVGYGVDFSIWGTYPYWLVRNSWGENWGEQGYIRLLREETPGCGTDSTPGGHVCETGPGADSSLHVCGMCGMLFETSYPLGAHLIQEHTKQ